jgi:prepilin signal peptidase PulO-like enzyme (type II secretory pathway)
MVGIGMIWTAFIGFSVFISVKDISTGLIPRILLWSALPCSLLLQYLFFGKNILFNAVFGGVLGCAVFFLAFFISGKRLGLADVWYAGLAGSVLGPVWWYPAMAVSCILAAGYIALFRRRYVPFIPFMAIGSGCFLPAAWGMVPGRALWAG